MKTLAIKYKLMSMHFATHLVLVLLLSYNLCEAQAPNWQVEENNFEHTMTMVAFLSVDNAPLENVNDKVVAFVDNEVRGVTNLTYVESENSYFAYLTVFANTSGETVSFKIYDSTNDVVKDISTTLEFEILSHHGSLLQAFSIASPKLSDQTNIINLGFEGLQTVDFSQSTDGVNIAILETGDLTVSTILFELSPGAKMVFERELLTSGVSQLNLENAPIEVQIKSEDQSNLRDVTIHINLIKANQPRIFKKNEVCHTPGVIKVIYNINGSPVVLSQNGNVVSEKSITNSEVVFDNLKEGTYQIEVGSVIKNVILTFINE